MRHAFATAICAAALLIAASQASGRVTTQVAVSPTSTGSNGTPVTLGPTTGIPVTITADPVGLSVEYQVLAADFGSGPCPPPAMVSTIQALGSPAIRIGGDSEDETAPAGTPQFAGITDLPDGFWSQLACLEQQTNEPIVIGLNLASQTPAWAASMAAGARSAVPANLLSFEIGNEADIDGPSVAWWNATELEKTLMPFSTYLDDAEALEQQLGTGAVVEGPDFATARWISEIPQIAKSLSLSTIDAHFYPLNACTDANEATEAALLAQGASAISPYVQQIQAEAALANLPMLISESNSVACRGKWGVSNSPASAVWGLRLVINAVRSGIKSVRFHSSGSSYDPFAVDGVTVSTRPLYDALETAVQLLPLGSTVSTLRTPSSLMGVLVTNSAGSKTYVLTNYSSQPVDVQIATPHSASVLTVQAHLPVVLPAQRAEAMSGTLTVAIAPNTVEAITPAT